MGPYLSEPRSAGARISRRMKEEIEIKHIIKPWVMEEGVWEIPIRRHHLSYSPILLPCNQFDLALPVGADVSFHMRVKRFKVRYI